MGQCRRPVITLALAREQLREAMTGKLGAPEMERYIRDAAETFWHQACTAKMGRDSMSS